jgi:hypothetical protein
MQDGYSAINELVTQHAAANNQAQNNSSENKVEGDGTGEKDPVEQQQQTDGDNQNQGAASQTQDPPEGGKATDPPAADPLADLLKEQGVDSIEALREKIKTAGEKPVDEVETPEAKKKAEDKHKAAVIKYAVDNELLSTDDVTKLETLKSKSDVDLVYEKYSTEVKDEVADEVREEAARKFKEENPDATEEEMQAAAKKVTQAEIDKKIKESFDREFPVNSKNEKAKARAASKIAKEAAEIRNPYESSFNTAKEKYEDTVKVRNTFPEYTKSIDKMVSEHIPDNVPFFKTKEGDEDVSVDVPISKEDRKDILDALSKEISNPSTYKMFTEGKTDEIKKVVQERMEFLLWKKYGDVGKQKIAETYHSRGLKKGSTTGAENSFEKNQGASRTAETKKTAAEANEEVIASTRAKK